MDIMLDLLDLLSACFPCKRFVIEDLQGFDGIVMMQGSKEYTNIFGFLRETWEPLALMTVKRVPPGAEGFHAANDYPAKVEETEDEKAWREFVLQRVTATAWCRLDCLSTNV